MKKGLLFVVGFGIGAMMFVVGGVNWQPTSSNCAGCAPAHPSMHRSRCTDAVNGLSVCEVP
jgi:hypothetical protein